MSPWFDGKCITVMKGQSRDTATEMYLGNVMHVIARWINLVSKCVVIPTHNEMSQ